RERALGLTEAHVVDVRGGDPAHQALVFGRDGMTRELREALGGILVPTERKVNLPGERQRADVVGVERLDLLEDAKRRLTISELPERPRALPQELDQLVRVVDHLEAAIDEGDEPRVILPCPDHAEGAPEGLGTPDVALGGPGERELAA